MAQEVVYDAYLAGQYAGDDFVDEVNIHLKEFAKKYKDKPINFDNEEFVSGFLEAFVSNLKLD